MIRSDKADTAARPETHQNLIHPDKEHTKPDPRASLVSATPQRPHAMGSTPSTTKPIFSAVTNTHALNTSSFSYLVETIGFEPMTPCLQSRCSPS